MKRKKHTPQQIIRKLREAEALRSEDQGLAEVCQRLAVSEATFHRWRDQYGGMRAQDAKRLKELELENTRLKKLVAEPALDKQILEEALNADSPICRTPPSRGGLWLL